MTGKPNHRVLFVDDSSADADLYADYFDGDETIEPVTALSAEDGLSRLESADIDCVVSDSVHTNDGEPLVTVAKQTYPEIPVLLHSGRSADKLPTEVVDCFLRKGTSTEEASALETLGESIREVAQSTPSSRDDAEQQWKPLGTFDWTNRNQSAVAVIEALADRTDSDPMTLGPLYECIDPDALTMLMRHGAQRQTSNVIEVSFDLGEFTIRTHSDGSAEYR